MSEDVLINWVSTTHSFPLIIERNVDFSDFSDIDIKECLVDRSWLPLMELGDTKVYPDLSRMFIANIFSKSSDKSSFCTMVKGKKFQITPTVISLILNIPIVEDSVKLPTNRHNTPSSAVVYKKLTSKFGTFGAGLSPNLLTYFNRVLYHIASYNLCPSSDSDRFIDREMAHFLYLISLGSRFCICTFIVDCFLSYNTSIPFCRVISRILAFFGIPLEDCESSKELDKPVLTKKLIDQISEEPVETILSEDDPDEYDPVEDDSSDEDYIG